MEQKLREMIEKMVGRKMVVPRDFAWLSEKVEERTQQRVSASTLRRFWGYVSEGVSASKFTKNVLANFLGYADFEEFGLSQGTGERQSQMVIGKEISCDDLYEGQMLKLSWLPDRTCIIRYQGNGSFKVVSSENTRLAKDDTFPDFDKMCTYKITYPNFQAFSKNNLCKWVTQRLFFVSLHHVCT